jgi:DHA2 family multidrug resistance protein
MKGQYLAPLPLFILAVAISLATFMIVLDYSIANVSIPYISGDLAVSNEQGTYVITSFAVGNAIALPLTGWLTKRVGAIRTIVWSLLLFVLFSWLCGAAFDFQMLVICRFLQGFCAGPLIPLSQTLIIMTHPPEKKTSALALWSAIVIAAPILGPILGGWLSYDYTWPWIFYINIPVGIVSAIVIWTIMHKQETPTAYERLDWVGLVLLTIGVSCLQILLDKGEQYDWLRSNWMYGFAVIAFISLTLLVVWSLTSKRPLMELRLLKIPTFGLSVLFIAIAYAIYFGSVVLIPLWLQENMGYTAIWAGFAVCPIGIAPLIFAKLTGKMVTKIGSIIPLAICFVLFAISCFYTAFFDTDVDIQVIGFSRFLLGCGLVFFITPLFALTVQDLSFDKLPSGTGIFHFVRAMVGGVGTSVFTTLWIRRSAYHHQVLGESVTPFAPEWKMFLEKLKGLGFTGQKALQIANDKMDDQAAMLALNDCFYLMGWIFLGLLIFLPIAHKKKRSQPHDPTTHTSVE